MIKIYFDILLDTIKSDLQPLKLTARFMCNCVELPQFVADIEYWNRGFLFQGAMENAAFFQVPDCECFYPSLNYEQNIYRCDECGQNWYIECLPEETPSPGFALKFSGSPPGDESIREAKESLCILAHGSFGTQKCKIAGCNNHNLNGRSLCHQHIPFL